MRLKEPPGRSGRTTVLDSSLAALLALAVLFVFAAPAPAYPPGVKAQIFPLASGLDPVHAYSLAFGPGEELWYAGSGNEVVETPSGSYYGGRIGLIGHVSADGQVVEIPLGPSPVGSITPGPDGAMWFTLSDDGEIGRVTTDGAVSRFPLPAGDLPGAIVTGPDGNLWFTERDAGGIGRITPTGSLSEYAFGARGATSGIVVGPDGNLWFTLTNQDRIGRLTTMGERAVFPLPKGVKPGAIVATAAGLWFTERSRSSGRHRPPTKIGFLSTDGRFRQVTIPAHTPVVALAADATGTVWYATKPVPGAIGSISPDGVPGRLRCVGSAGCTLPPIALTVAPDSKLWFATGTGECRICGGGTAIAQQYEPGNVGYLLAP